MRYTVAMRTGCLTALLIISFTAALFLLPVSSETSPGPPPPIVEAVCSCAADTRNCGDFQSHAEAQMCFETCQAQTGRDVHRLDGNDNDGLACESLP